MGGPAHVEQHGGAALPGLLLLADEQLVVAGGGGPVDAAQVVAHHVRPQRVEVVAGPAEEWGWSVPARGSLPLVNGTGRISSIAG